jgi:hypothetical protein
MPVPPDMNMETQPMPQQGDIDTGGDIGHRGNIDGTYGPDVDLQGHTSSFEGKDWLGVGSRRVRRDCEVTWETGK